MHKIARLVTVLLCLILSVGAGGHATGAAETRDVRPILEEAGRAADAIENDRWRALSWMGIAAVEVRLGDAGAARRAFDRAVEAAGGIEDPRDKASTLCTIATAQAKGGDYQAGLRTLDASGLRLDSTSDSGLLLRRSRAIWAIVRAQVKAGELEAAFQTAETAEAGPLGQAELTMICEAQLEAGDIEGAVQTAEGISNDLSKGSASVRIAAAQAQAGDIEGALRTAETIKDAYLRGVAFGFIGTAQAEAGDIKGARQSVESIRDWVGQAPVAVLAGIAKAEGAAGDPVAAEATICEAVQIAESESMTPSGMWAFLRIAESQVATGDEAGAKASFRKALQVVEHMPARSRAQFFVDIARAQEAVIGRAAAAHTLARASEAAEIGSRPSLREHYLLVILDAQARVQDRDGVRRTAQRLRRIGEEQGHGGGTRAISRAQVQLGEADAALSSALEQSEPLRKVQALLGVAEGLSGLVNAE